MKCLLVAFALFGVALSLPVPHDTPEVAAAKAKHLAIHAAETSRNLAHGHGHYGAAYPAVPHYAPIAHGYAPATHAYAPAHNVPYHGPVALPPGYDKHGAPLPVHDTPEVAAEKHHKLSILAHYGGATHPAAPYPGDWVDHDDGHGPVVGAAYGHNYAPSWSKSYAPAPIVHGVVVDTPEVAHAKAAHFAAHAAARAHAPAHGPSYHY